MASPQNSQVDGNIELLFDGVRYGFWQSVSVRESVDDLCASVSFQAALPGVGSGLNLTANTVATVLIDGALVTTIRPDRVRRRVGASDHVISVEGRSLGRELVDCQYSRTLSGLRLEEIVKRVCGAFKVPVKIIGKTAVVPDFAMQCEIPANALINAARAANLLLYPLPDGGLILTGPTSDEPVATLVYGEHIKQYDIVDEHKLRFSEYRVKAFDYEGDRPVSGTIRDDGITFYRPMHVIADRHGKGLGACDRRANFERNRRLARSHRIDLEIPGWKHAGGVWAVNTRVRVVIPQEGVDDVLLIGERELVRDDKGGKVTRLQVMRREAFLGEEAKKQKRSAGPRK